MHRNSFLRYSGILLFVFWLVTLAFMEPAMAGGLQDARRRGKLIAGVKTDFPPFGYLDSSGAPLGIDAEIARHLAETIYGDEAEALELVPVTSGSRIPFLYNNWIDVIVASVTVTEARKKVLEFSKPYFLSGSMLLVPGDSAVEDTGGLAGKTVAVIEGSTQEKDIEQVAPQARVVSFPELSTALNALRQKRADALCQDDEVILGLAKANPDLKAVGVPFNVRHYAIAVKKGDMEFIQWIDAQLDRMKEDGTIEKIIRKYIGGNESSLPKP